MDVDSHLKAYADKIADHLDQLLPSTNLRPEPLFEAMRYSCLAPGKRLRPALCLAACEAVQGRAEWALSHACAIEMIHCFSLIHDDLPALDDDDLRRGLPTCHKVYGEAVAILAGDALFCHAFQVALQAPIDPAVNVRSCALLAEAVGVEGVVAGETADLLAEGVSVDADTLEFIHLRKTASLIRASCEIGAVIGLGSPPSCLALRSYGEAIGLAFQIVDDVLNVTSTAAQLGKRAGSDQARGKATYPALFGLDESRRKALDLVDRAVGYLDTLTGPTAFLRELARYSVERVY